MRGGCKVMGPLSLVVFLLVCNAKQIYGEALNGMVGVHYNTWPIEHPAGSGVYESDSNSLPSDNGIQSTKSFGGMMGRRILAEEKSNSAEGRRSEHSRWIARTIHHLRRAAGHIALDLKHFASKSQEIVAAVNHDQLSGTGGPSSVRTLTKSNLHEAKTRTDDPVDAPKLQRFGKQRFSRSLKSFLNSLHDKHRRNTSFQEVSKQQQSPKSDKLGDNNSYSKLADSTKYHPSTDGTSTPPAEIAYQPFSSAHSTSQASNEDDIADITGMDYSPAKKKPPIHNKAP